MFKKLEAPEYIYVNYQIFQG